MARKSLVAACAISTREPFTVENLTIKRPGHGLAPMHYWELLNRQANRDFSADEVITP